MKLIIAGAGGRMGQALIEAANNADGFELAGAFEAPGSPAVGNKIGSIEIVDDPVKIMSAGDAVIDFTAPEATLKNIAAAAEAGVKAVIGTTGMNPEQIGELKNFSDKIPICFAPNFSIGVNLLINLAAAAASVLGDGYDVEVIEAHHRHKKDAPSGTAIRLAEAIADALGRDYKQKAVYERKGIIGERTSDEIGMQTIRGGDIVGEHTLMFIGVGERIELTHRASNRQTFAQGAVRAAGWLADKQNGFYDMQDVLGLKG